MPAGSRPSQAPGSRSCPSCSSTKGKKLPAARHQKSGWGDSDLGQGENPTFTVAHVPLKWGTSSVAKVAHKPQQGQLHPRPGHLQKSQLFSHLVRGEADSMQPCECSLLLHSYRSHQACCYTLI